MKGNRARNMKYSFEYYNSEHERRYKKLTCNVSSLVVQLSDDDYYYPHAEIIRLMDDIIARTRVHPFAILYRYNPYGFNRIEKYKRLKAEESYFSLADCHRFDTTDDDGCSYMYSCDRIDTHVTLPNILGSLQSLVFLATDSNYQEILNAIPQLKSIKEIKNYLIQSELIVVDGEDTCDVGYYLWFTSSEKKIRGFFDDIRTLCGSPLLVLLTDGCFKKENGSRN